MDIVGKYYILTEVAQTQKDKCCIFSLILDLNCNPLDLSQENKKGMQEEAPHRGMVRHSYYEKGKREMG